MPLDLTAATDDSSLQDSPRPTSARPTAMVFVDRQGDDTLVVRDAKCQITVRRVGEALEIASNKARSPKAVAIAAIIVARQFEHFARGAELVPLILADIAVELGFDASTISRAGDNVIVSERASLPFRDYLTASRVRTTDGGEVTGRHAAALIKACIDAEDPRAPLSDERLRELLEEQGVLLARRTVALYRGELGIPASDRRRR